MAERLAHTSFQGGLTIESAITHEINFKALIDELIVTIAETENLLKESVTLIDDCCAKMITLEKSSEEFKHEKAKFDSLKEYQNDLTESLSKCEAILHDTKNELTKMEGKHVLLKRKLN